ncbi:hypothetical protein [Actinomadura rugatobispora]|uniref:Uncharacterized protein n=1 Tax=Actinomadura rugatobispora TaxID=1994 RepID=A0ABW0ZNE7_9ACTN|nr:hypothetical protein GCM10010200_035490 [Actinomadura rugatobispora]
MTIKLKLAAAALTLAAGTSGLALAPSAALAAPAAPTSAPSRALAAPAFNASGTYQLFQSNGAAPRVNVTQDGSGRLFGSASFGDTVGTIEEGAVEGTSISFTIGWSSGARGRYVGSLGSDRRLTGVTFDLTHPSSQATWFTNRTF